MLCFLFKVFFYIFQSEKGWDLDITQGQWENGRLRCSIYQYHGTAQFQPASFGGQGGPGDIRLPWLGHLCHGKRPLQAEPTARLTAYVSFFQGTWKNYILQRGRYCKITKVSNKVGLKLAIKTEEMNTSPELRYLPPSYNSYGPPPTQTDPFEMNTVEVNCSDIYNRDKNNYHSGSWHRHEGHGHQRWPGGGAVRHKGHQEGRVGLLLQRPHSALASHASAGQAE